MAQQQMAYNPYSAQNAASPSSPYGNPMGQNPFMNGGQNEGPKTFSIPTWLFWLIILAFLGFTSWLVWYLYFA